MCNLVIAPFAEGAFCYLRIIRHCPAAPASRQPVIKPADLVKGKYTRNAAGEIVPVEPSAKQAKPAFDGNEDSFVTGLGEGMKDLPEVKENGPEGIDFAAEGGKAGVLSENITSPEIIDYKKVFFEKYPDRKGKVVVHHSVEQQVLRKFSGMFSVEEINKVNSLRGIPISINNEVHLSEIRREWNKFYKAIRKGEIAAIKGNFIKKAQEIDVMFGDQFDPPVK
jgi:hypothetical protein